MDDYKTARHRFKKESNESFNGSKNIIRRPELKELSFSHLPTISCDQYNDRRNDVKYLSHFQNDNKSFQTQKKIQR